MIEVSGTCFDSDEFPMMTHYFRSFGHMPVGDPSLLDILERCSQVVDSCSAPDDSPCPMEDRYKIFVSDISWASTRPYCTKRSKRQPLLFAPLSVGIRTGVEFVV